MMRGYVETRWGQLHYAEAGTGDRTVVLFHETPLNHRCYQRLVPLLAESFRVIAFDTPGYGESDPPPSTTTIEEYAATFAEGVDALGIDRAVLYGHHTGASFAFELAADPLRDRVDGLALSGLPFYTDEVRAGKVVVTEPEPRDDGSHLVETFDWEPAVYDPEVRSRLVTGVSKHRGRAYDAFHAVYTYEPAKVLDRITCPILLLSHAGDPLFAADNRVKAARPEARQVVIDVERMPVYWLAPEVVAAEVGKLAS